MIIPFLKNEIKNKYYPELKKANENNIFKLNLYFAVFLIIMHTVILFLFDPIFFQSFSNLIFWARIQVIIVCSIVLIASFFTPLKKFSMLFSFLIALSSFLYASSLMYILKNNSLALNTWILHIILICGIYPIPAIRSIILYLISLAYFLLGYYKFGNASSEYLGAVLINGNCTFIISIIFKYFFMRLKEKEFYSKKEIAELNEKLKSFDKIKTDFFSNISHEIRTPLTLFKTPIESYFEGKIKIKDINDFLSNLLRNAQRLSNLINNLLDFSKLDEGRMTLSVKETDVNNFIQNYIYSFKTSAELKNITLEFINLTKNLKILIDQDKIDKVLMNILSNALKFTDPDGKIIVKIWNDVKHLFIEFADNGPGIPENMKDAVFERFRQVDSDLNRGHEGCGIGLALAKEYMVMHGGRIALESKYFKDFPENHGCKFTLVFFMGKKHFEKMDNIRIIFNKDTDKLNGAMKPFNISETYQHSKNPVVSAGNNSLSKPNILVVDDNPEMADFIADILKEDYNVLFAKNGIETIEKLNLNKIDLVLSDIMMPEMDGYTLLKSIRMEDRFSRIPVIMLTAKTDDKMKINSLENGANDYLTKPFNSRELLARIRTQIHLKLFMEKLNDKIDLKNKSKIDISASIKNKLEYAIDFLNNNFLDIISRENLAATLGINPDYLSRLFKQYTGKKVQEYLNELRIRYAAGILTSSNKKIIDVAMESGFETLRTFNREFVKQMNINPSEYRLKNNSQKQ